MNPSDVNVKALRGSVFYDFGTDTRRTYQVGDVSVGLTIYDLSRYPIEDQPWLFKS